MMARKLSTIIFINILKTNLVWSRPKYGISTIMIRKPLIQPCLEATISSEWLYIWFQVGSAVTTDIFRLFSALK